jgi:tetratricopeptide (TPR) repeat protein
MLHRRYLLLLLPFLIVLCACSSGPKRYIEKGNKLFEAKRFNEALLQYQKAVQKDPSSSEAYYRLGLAELKLGSVGEAVEALQNAADRSPQNPEPKVMLCELLLAAYLGNKDHPEDLGVRLAKLADSLLAQDANSFDGLKVKGALALADGNAPEAIGYFQKANQAKPLQPELIQLLCASLIRNGQADEGERMALDLIGKRKDYGPIYEFLYEYYLGRKRPGDAENMLRAMVGNNPGNGAFVTKLAAHFARLGKENEMRVALQPMLDDAQRYPAGRLLAGDFYRSSGKWDEALQLYQDGAKLDAPRKLLYQEKIAGVLASQGKADEAQTLVDQILREHPGNEETRLAKDRLLVDTGRPEAIGRAITDLKGLADRHPDDTSLKYTLGRAYAAKNDLKTARDEFAEAIPNPGTYVLAHLGLAQIDKLEQNWKSMLQHADFALLMEPSNSGARLLHATALAGMGDIEKGRFELRGLLRDNPGIRDAQFQLGYLELSQGNYAEAETIFKSQFAPGKGDTAGLAAMTELYCARKTCDKAVQLLKDDLRRAPESEIIQNLLADAAARAGDFDVAIAQYQALLARNPSSNLHLRLGAALFEKGDDAQAIAHLEQAQKMNPGDPVSATMLAGVSGRAEDRDKAIAACRQAWKDDPNNIAAENNLAALLADRGNLDEALALAQKAAEAMPWQPHFVDTLGYVMAKKGMSDDAVLTLEKLVRDHPADPVFRYHYAFALTTKGDRPGALSELQKALAGGPSRANKKEIQQLLAQVN